MPLKKLTTTTQPPLAKKLATDLGALEKKPTAPSSNAGDRPFAGEQSTRGISTNERKTLGETIGAGSARKGFGLFLSDKQAGAKAAIAGLGFFDGTVGKAVKKGVISALAGLTLVTALLTTPAPVGNVFNRAPTERSSSIDVRALNMMTASTKHIVSRGERALPEAQAVVAKWEADKASDPAFTVTTDRARELVLAALLPAVPGPTDDLATFAKANLGGDTKQLLGTLLDGSSFTLADDAKALFEVLTDRVLVSADGKLKITGDQSGEKLRLAGAAGATVEALNLSTIPTKRIMLGETFAVGTVGPDGKFEGDMPMRAGDHVRVRLKLADGTATDWVELKASGLGADTRNAEVAMFRVGLSDAGNGQINVTNINSSRTISEPNALLRFVNVRTSEATDVRLNKDGSFDAGTKVPGAPGDSFSVRVSDGANDTSLATEIGKLKVGTRNGGSQVHDFDLPDPGLHRDEIDEAGKPKFNLERFRGPLFDVDGAKATDVQQGQIGDCYLPAAVAAIAHHVPGHFENMIKQKIELDPITFTEKISFEVTFHERSWENGKTVFKPVVQVVDADLFVRSYGGPLYGTDDGPRGLEDMELWWPILEKAYADWKGDYNTIGDGGHVSTVFADMLGVETDSTSIGRWGGSADDIWKQIVETIDAKRPIGAGTHGHDQDALYANSGVYSNHAYSILAYETAADGTKYVQVRNPWGESEPFPGDGKNDGIFKLKLDDFMKLYSNLYFVTGD